MGSTANVLNSTKLYIQIKTVVQQFNSNLLQSFIHRDAKGFLTLLGVSLFSINALECTDDLFKKYTLPYKKTIESIEKGQKGSVWS